jgi:hypothetical protein
MAPSTLLSPILNIQCNPLNVKAPVKYIVLLIPIVLECIDQFNLTTAEGFVTYLRAANATGALTTQYHSSMGSLIERLSSISMSCRYHDKATESKYNEIGSDRHIANTMKITTIIN